MPPLAYAAIYGFALVLLVAPFHFERMRHRERHYHHELLKAVWILWSRDFQDAVERAKKALVDDNEYELAEANSKAAQLLVRLELVDRGISLVRGRERSRSQRKEAKTVLRNLGILNAPAYPLFAVVDNLDVTDHSWRYQRLDSMRAALGGHDKAGTVG
jgi:hypothetical protein